MKSGKANRRRMLAGMLALSVLCTSGVIRTGASVSAAATVAGLSLIHISEPTRH